MGEKYLRNCSCQSASTGTRATPTPGPHLACDVGVGESHDHAMFGCVVLVLVLSDEALAGIVVRLSLYKEQKMAV